MAQPDERRRRAAGSRRRRRRRRRRHVGRDGDGNERLPVSLISENAPPRKKSSRRPEHRHFRAIAERVLGALPSLCTSATHRRRQPHLIGCRTRDRRVLRLDDVDVIVAEQFSPAHISPPPAPISAGAAAAATAGRIVIGPSSSPKATDRPDSLILLAGLASGPFHQPFFGVSGRFEPAGIALILEPGSTDHRSKCSEVSDLS